jgi:hypothetical protein
LSPPKAFALEYGSVDEYDGSDENKFEMSDHTVNKEEEVPDVIKHIVEEE